MTPEQMRIKLHSCSRYPVGDWNADVEAMSDKKVAAIYMRFLNRGWIK